MKVLLNGSIKDSSMVQDALEPGLLFGWGVFETLRIYKGKPAFLQEHIKRLKQGCDKTLLRLPELDFRKNIQVLLKKNRLKNANCRITIFKKNTNTGVLIAVAPLNQYKRSDYKNGFQAIIAPFVKNSKDFLTGIKSTSYLENILARKIASNKGKQEAIFLNESGFLTEGSRSNLFFVKRNIINTPSTQCGILNGITRQKVISITKKLRMRVRVDKFKLKDLLCCDEAFLTSSLMEVIPLVKIGSIVIGNGQPGKLTYIIHSAYKELVHNSITKDNG